MRLPLLFFDCLSPHTPISACSRYNSRCHHCCKMRHTVIRLLAAQSDQTHTMHCVTAGSCLIHLLKVISFLTNQLLPDGARQRRFDKQYIPHPLLKLHQLLHHALTCSSRRPSSSWCSFACCCCGWSTSIASAAAAFWPPAVSAAAAAAESPMALPWLLLSLASFCTSCSAAVRAEASSRVSKDSAAVSLLPCRYQHRKAKTEGQTQMRLNCMSVHANASYPGYCKLT